MPNKGLITALAGSIGFVRALRRAFGTRNLLPEFLGVLLREQNQRRQNEKEQTKNFSHRVQDTLDFLFSIRAIYIYIFVARLSDGLSFLNQ